MRIVLGSVLTLLLVAGPVTHAANQNILGSSLTVKDPSTPDKRKLTGKAKEKVAPETIVGDPTVTGATLTVRVGGGSPNEQTFSLPQGTSPSSGKPYWTGNAVKGFVYKDGKFENGTPIKAASIKKSGSGTFQIKVNGSGKVAPLNVVPPNPGTNGCILLSITGGDSYSVQFAPLDGVITNKGPLQYAHKKVGLEGSCTTTTTTTSTTTTTTTTTSTTTTTLCSNQAFTFTVGAHDDTSIFDDIDLSDEWLGGSQTQTQSASCTATVSRPSGNIDLVGLLGNKWVVTSFTGFSNCFGFAGEDGDGCNTPVCDALFAFGLCQDTRPSCSSALGGGGSSASFNVQCLQ